MSLTGFATMMFGSLGDAVAKLCGDLEASGIRLYPRAYGSLVLFATFMTIIVSVILSSFFVVGYTFFSIRLGIFGEIFIIPALIMSLPAIVFLIGIGWPRMKVSGISSSLSSEVPYAAAYTAVMSTGGISPYASIMRLSRVPLLPTFSKTAKLLDLMVRGLGYDPVTALEEIGKKLPSKDFRELLLGYASTLKTGGDVVHYLLRRTELLFQERLENLKMIGGRLGQIMEVYMVIALLLLLGIYTIYAVQLSVGELLGGGGGFFGSVYGFMLFSYVFLPFISLIFLWMIDVVQPKYPMEDNSPYVVFAATGLPILAILVPSFYLSFIMPGLRIIPVFDILARIMERLVTLLGLEKGYEPTIGLTLTLMIATIPAMAYRIGISIREKGMDIGFSGFLRDLVEIRKSGLSPEKCIINLSERNYGKLSKHIKTMATQISWGISHSKIYETFSKHVRSWLTKISMFLLLDAIEVGGGTPETLETLAQFNESIILMEKEKRSELKPLLSIPYIGTGVLVITVIALLTFFRSMLLMAGRSMAFVDILHLLLPPVIIHVYMMGLVGGKIAYGEVSQGFLHSFLLLIFTLVTIILSPYYSFAPVPTGGGTIG
ncbi:MAG: type II secretion system F family protein [Thermoproteota archaeon]